MIEERPQRLAPLAPKEWSAEQAEILAPVSAGKGLGRGVTLGGCRILPRRNQLLIVREPAAVPSMPVRPGEKLRWDARFDIAVSRAAGGVAGALVLAPLGEAGWDALSRGSGGAWSGTLPAAAGAGLPALSDRRGLLSVPHLGYGRGPEAGQSLIKCAFAPENPLTGPRFTVA